MHRVFAKRQQIKENVIRITGDDYYHISRSLRMSNGEEMIAVVDGQAYRCILCNFTKESLDARIISNDVPCTESPANITLYQAITKNDSDSIVRRAVECGASEIVFFSSVYCISKSNDNFLNKLERLNRISKEAAEQCGRNIIPKISGCITFEEMLNRIDGTSLFCFEGNGTEPIYKILQNFNLDKINLIIGSEGGFSQAEAESAQKKGALLTGLGPRILRAETASSFALAAISCYIEQ